MLPYFFVEDLSGKEQQLPLNEENSKHLVQVLRKKQGEEIILTNGVGAKARGVLANENRKSCLVQITSFAKHDAPQQKVCIAISLVKNTARFEWFLEKATEIGVSEIIPLLCQRTEKQNFRIERMKNIVVSAMLQSQQTYMPVLRPVTKFADAVENADYSSLFIAHCLPGEKQQLSSFAKMRAEGNDSSLVFIGPEGDFTEDEIRLAGTRNCIPVALGENRLRTETAGIVAAVLLRSS